MYICIIIKYKFLYLMMKNKWINLPSLTSPLVQNIRKGRCILYESSSIYRDVIFKLFWSPEIDFQPGGPVRKSYLLNRPARLHGLAESIPGLINVYECVLGTANLFLLGSLPRKIVLKFQHSMCISTKDAIFIQQGASLT